ncbi:RRP15-like protein [Folsomia candida]|nr:RRP15-like protein [Folsomia candida]
MQSLSHNVPKSGKCRVLTSLNYTRADWEYSAIEMVDVSEIEQDYEVNSSSDEEEEEDEEEQLGSSGDDEGDEDLSSSDGDEDDGESKSSGNDEDQVDEGEEPEIDSSAGEEEGDDDDDDDKPSAGDEQAEVSGWADSIAKILKSTKPKNKKELMLSRARKDYEVNKTVVKVQKRLGAKVRPLRKEDDLEIVPSDKPKSDDVLKREKESDEPTSKTKKDDNILSLKVQRKLELKQKKLELAWENLARMNAEKADPEMERDLVKMATKGVVQLFNAISMQQKTIKTKLKTSEKSEFKKDKILNQTKDIFDNAMIKSKNRQPGNSRSSNNNDNGDKEAEIKEEDMSSDDDDEMVGLGSVSIKINKRPSTDTKKGQKSVPSKKKPVWNALQDDFMLNAKLKDWDKDSDSD